MVFTIILNLRNFGVGGTTSYAGFYYSSYYFNFYNSSSTIFWFSNFLVDPSSYALLRDADSREDMRYFLVPSFIYFF